MSKRAHWLLGSTFGAAAVIAACSGGDARAPFIPIVPADAAEFDAPIGRRDAAALDGGGGMTDGAAETGTPTGVVLPLCGASFSLASATSIVGAAAPLSISEDELRVAWADGAVDNATLHMASRANLADPFVETSTLSAAEGPFALERPVLNPQGNYLAALATDRKQFKLFERATREAPFVASARGVFAQVNSYAAALPAAELLHDPVWGPGGRTLLFGVATKGILVAEAVLGADDFGTPRALSAKPELQAIGSMRKRPSGTAPDERVLFYFDETNGQTFAATRASVGVDFSTFVALGAIREVQVRASCKNLYFVENGMFKVAAQR